MIFNVVNTLFFELCSNLTGTIQCYGDVATDVFLRIKVEPRERKGNVPDLTATFWYSLDGRKWTQMKDASLSGKDASFIGKAGTWIGAKFGFYCNRLSFKNDSGWMQVDWITVTE
jgi:hypothetical protein